MVKMMEKKYITEKEFQLIPVTQVVRDFEMCIRDRPISASNFFHGTLEVIDKDTSVILIKGEDKTRPLMDRVENFVHKISAKVTVFDSKDYELTGISDEFRGCLLYTSWPLR